MRDETVKLVHLVNGCLELYIIVVPLHRLGVVGVDVDVGVVVVTEIRLQMKH